MATRGCIARKTDTGFAGVYHHWDSYPEGLGKTLYKIFNKVFNQDLEAMLKYLIDDHPAGWSTIVGGDFSQQPGFEEGGFTTKGPKCYCHGGRGEPGSILTGDSNWEQYVYIFSQENETPIMEIKERASGKINKIILTDPEPDWQRI